MDSRQAAILGLLIALAATNAAWYTLYSHSSSNIAHLVQSNKELNNIVEELSNRVRNLNDQNTKLLLELRDLRSRYMSLVNYIRQANETIKKTLTLLNILDNLNTTITAMYEYTYKHAYFTPATRSLFQPASVSDLVLQITGTPAYTEASWRQDMAKMYNWTVKNIMTAPDQNFMAIKDLQYVKIGQDKYIYSFTVDIINNYIQSPIETLQRHAGDCEDLAILLGSMYKIYLHDVGDAWAMCLIAKDIQHCFTVAYVKLHKTYILADPAMEFYVTSSSLDDALQQWLNYMGMKRSDIDRAIVFNNIVFKEGSLSQIEEAIQAWASKT